MKSLTKALRRKSTDAEQLLWKHLRNRQLAGHKFRRQELIEPYIVDFVCIEAKLIIEADGGQHTEQIEYDKNRTQKLQAMGYTILRFWDNEILGEIDTVLEQIQNHLIVFPHPSPLPEGEGA
ncbi:MAG: endonuclease domain-containing protein [Gammaproteobacteria bacterium]|nr:endonuclease domain-containing protein [Gammaproteobacteria bacterium]